MCPTTTRAPTDRHEMDSSAPPTPERLDRLALSRAVLGFVDLLAPRSGRSLEQVMRDLMSASAADAMILHRVHMNESHAMLVPETWVERDGFDLEPGEFQVGADDPLHRALRDHEAWVVTDSAALDTVHRERYAVLDPPRRAEVVVPILIERRPVAAVSLIVGEPPYDWTADEVRALWAAAAMVEAHLIRTRDSAALAAAVSEVEIQARINKALLDCSQALLLESGDEAIHAALEALRHASQAMLVYIDENVECDENGPCMRTRYWALRDDVPVESFAWLGDLLPWSELPETYQVLSGGGILRTDRPEDRSEVEAAFLTGVALAQAEICAPVTVDGEWVASVGIYDDHANQWSDLHVDLVEAVAVMFGAYWTREKRERELRETMASRDEFVASVSHELRTPLSAVVGFASELRDFFDDFDHDTRLDLILLIARQAGDVSFLVDDLLVAARSRQAGLRLDPSLLELVAETYSTLSSLPPEYAQSVEVIFDSPIQAFADARRVRQVLRNLVVNARKYGGPACEIRLFGGDGEAVIQVRDNGPEVPSALRSRMFDAYASGGDGAGPLPSMGLGLTVSRQLAEYMGGRLQYLFDGWSVFEVRLPGRPSTDPVK